MREEFGYNDTSASSALREHTGCGSSSVVELLPSKQVVVGSNPISRSTLYT